MTCQAGVCSSDKSFLLNISAGTGILTGFRSFINYRHCCIMGGKTNKDAYDQQEIKLVLSDKETDRTSPAGGIIISAALLCLMIYNYTEH